MVGFPLLLPAGACWLGGHFGDPAEAKWCAACLAGAALLYIALMER